MTKPYVKRRIISESDVTENNIFMGKFFKLSQTYLQTKRSPFSNISEFQSNQSEFGKCCFSSLNF